MFQHPEHVSSGCGVFRCFPAFAGGTQGQQGMQRAQTVHTKVPISGNRFRPCGFFISVWYVSASGACEFGRRHFPAFPCFATGTQGWQRGMSRAQTSHTKFSTSGKLFRLCRRNAWRRQEMWRASCRMVFSCRAPTAMLRKSPPRRPQRPSGSTVSAVKAAPNRDGFPYILMLQSSYSNVPAP